MKNLQPLSVDVYAGDGPKDWAAFCAAGPPWHVAVFKCSQGTYYRPGAYVSERAKFLRSAGPDHFNGAYHYLDFGIDGAAQAEYAVTSAGMRVPNTLPMMVDVERGGQRIQDPSRALVTNRVVTFANRYFELTGRRPTLYGGELLRSLGITDRLGCALSAVALYSANLGAHEEGTAAFLARTGTDLEHLLLWQYRGTEPQANGPAGYPMTAPGCGVVDISAVTLPGGIPALHELCRA
jgi:GH25 family lysozyme M1 (1,4-beta-N-acetylmuramidase)